MKQKIAHVALLLRRIVAYDSEILHKAKTARCMPLPTREDYIELGNKRVLSGKIILIDLLIEMIGA